MPITFDQIKIFDSGARFYTADLHVHSFDGSADVADSTMTVEALIDTAFSSKLSILAVTDHNSDANLHRALEYATKYTGQLLVLPGVEITTAHGHLLVVFAPEKADGVRDLLAVIRIVGQRGARDSHTTLSMADVIGEAERLGGLCIAAHIDRSQTGFETLAKGYPNWKKDIICSSGLYGLEFDDPNRLMWYSPDDEPTPDGGERKKHLHARSQIPAIAARCRLAAIQNSDAHALVDFTTQHTKRFLTRFKMNDLSFEGLRTALIDPEARVRAVATIPSAVPRVLGMQVSGGFLDTSTFHFSDNLNCFIGGRGTGKSTAIKSLAYGLGLNNDFEKQENCPDNVVIYCEDADGVRYRYERVEGHQPSVQAKEDQSIKDVPADAFRVEFYGQGELAEVAKDPLKNPRLLQDFLDRHIVLADLAEREREILEELDQNNAQLIPLEAAAAQLPARTRALAEVDKKLKVAETGRLKDIAAFQTRLAAEKTLCDLVTEIQKTYTSGLSLAKFRRDFTVLVASAGTLTGDAQSEPFLQQVKSALTAAATLLDTQEQFVNERLTTHAAALHAAVEGLRKRHRELDQQINASITDFQKKGLSGDLKGLNELIKQRALLQFEISKIEGQKTELDQLRSNRQELLARLTAVRSELMDRRKSQLALINKNLRRTIEDYAINIYYDPAGIIDEFKKLITDVLRGTYFQDEVAGDLCTRTTPAELAGHVRNRDTAALASLVGETWTPQLMMRFALLTNFHMLETVAKPPKPVIKVLTRGPSPKEIPVTQLSDGQKHTILLTIAMLAESNLPLIIDQPEDDLDNAFIFKSVVATLRAIKERRQVIVVTHNANIAVLGDSELLFPMKRSGDKGQTFDRGSIDRKETRIAVQNILEGGELAFRRRMEIYGY